MRAPNQHNLYNIPAGVPFLKALAANLLNGRLFPDFAYDPGRPHALADILIYVPTRRAVRSLRAEIAEQVGRASVILPDIKPLGEAEDDLGIFDEFSDGQFPLKEPISNTQSKIILAELILAWKQALPRIFNEQLQSVPMVAPASPADALWLADDLLSLIQSAESEEIELANVDQIDAGDHAQWWQLTLEFLKILRHYWPERLEELNRQSSTRHQILQINRQVEKLSIRPPRGPIMVAGSTGSLPATARLIKTISKLENGAVILPGLDQYMTEDQWQSIYSSSSFSNDARLADKLISIVTQGHPQFGLARLLTKLDVRVEDITEITNIQKPPQNLQARAKLISKAMLPVENTHEWASGTNLSPDEEKAACERISLIEASNEREEAATLATAIRIALEQDKDNDEPDVALVTPDRNLARRVSIELLNFGIKADDSGGLSLIQTKLGSLLQIAAEFTFKKPNNLLLASLLKHPLAQLSAPEGDRFAAASVIERLLLRRIKRDLDPRQLPDLLAENLKSLSDKRHVPKWLLSISDEDKTRAVEFVNRLANIFETVFTDPDQQKTDPSAFQQVKAPIEFWIGKTITLMEAFTRSDDGNFDIWACDAGQELINIVDDIRSCPSEFEISGSDWADMIAPLLNGSVVKPATGSHPRVMIWGALEARLQTVDTLILAGLNEGTWPGTSANDPFLSRTMKSEIGLEPPERKLGLAAHDFQMAMGAKNVILSRSLKSNGAPSVASRWIQRLETILSESCVRDLRARGSALLQHAQTKPGSDDLPVPVRPSPKPDVKFQPKSYSFSEISTLRRDPYAIYARKILKLDPMEEFASEPDLRERGTIYHAIIEAFSKEFSDIPVGQHLNVLHKLMNSEFSNYDLPTETAFIWKDRFHQVSHNLLDWEFERQPQIEQRFVELSARCQLPGQLEINLTGYADRIDLFADGGVEIIDFKTGTAPSAKEARSLLDPQLPLEAYAISQGGFKGLGQHTATSLKYVRLKPADKLQVDQIETSPSKSNPDSASASELGEKAANELSSLLVAFADNRYGFLSRAIPKMQQQASGDYDQLARVSEWSVAELSDDGNADD